MTADALQVQRVEKRFQAISQREYLPADMVGLLAAVHELQAEAAGRCRAVVPDESDLTGEDQHLQGKPLLAAVDFPYDKELTAELAGKVLTLMEKIEGPVSGAARIMRSELDGGDLDMEKAVAAFMSRDEDFLVAFAAKTPEAPMALTFLLTSALAPSLHAVASELNARRETEAVWSHGHCPVCGEPPLISVLDGKEGRRVLTCSFCRTEYRARRIACPFCGETEAEKLKIFQSEDEPGYRVDVCETCKSYIKTVDFRNLDKVSVPLLDDLESLALDMAASQEGYSRPTLSGWGF